LHRRALHHRAEHCITEQSIASQSRALHHRAEHCIAEHCIARIEHTDTREKNWKITIVFVTCGSSGRNYLIDLYKCTLSILYFIKYSDITTSLLSNETRLLELCQLKAKSRPLAGTK